MLLEFITGFLPFYSDILYWVKFIISVIALQIWKRIQSKRVNDYNFEAENEPEKLAILVPKKEKILESPFPEEHLQNASDEVFIYGVNSQSDSLVVRVNRMPNDEAEAWIYLKLKDGRSYELQEKNGYQRNYGGKCSSFTCGGLQMQYQSPMRRWRIVYCGMLKERNGENEERKEVFVKFTFLWRASSEGFDFLLDFDDRVAADAIARAKWTHPYPPVEKFSELMNYYCQSGNLNGTVSIEDKPDIQMYLFGERIRNLGKCSHAVGYKFKHILLAIPESGLIVHLLRASVTNAFQNFNFGFIVHPDTHIRTVKDAIIITKKNSTDLKLEADFSAEERQYKLLGKNGEDVISFSGYEGKNGLVKLVEINFEADGLKGSGFMLSGQILKPFERKREKKFPRPLSTTHPRTVTFTDDLCQLTELTGGKGSSLGVLTKLSGQLKSEFIVPKGLIVTTAAYKEFLSNDITNKIEKLKDIAYGNIHGNIQEACKMVSSFVEKSRLPGNVKREIEEKLKLIFGGNIFERKFAVRSSATGEDTDQMSAAGQMDTFLGVQGLEEIFTAAKKCWASQFSYIATEYKRQNGQILNSPMAVVIQEMVDCEAAGVLFTCDPVTNNPSVTVITGNYGLGESVVSGSEEPDTFFLKKISKHKIEIESVTVGMKQHRIVMAGTKATDLKDTVLIEDVPDDKRNECCISNEMALKLGELSLKIEDFFKSPRDIEWGIKENAIYIFQSRPITTGAATTDHEIKHDLDGPLRSERDCYTICNVGEAMPGATSPLGLDLINKYFSLVFNRKCMREHKKDSYMQHIYFRAGCLPFCNHLAIGVADMLVQMGDLESMAAKGMMIAMFGRVLDDQEVKTLVQYREREPIKFGLRPFLRMLYRLFFSGSGLEALKEEIFSYQCPAERGKTSVEILDLITHSSTHFIKPGTKHIICSGISSMWNMFIFATLKNAKGCIDTDVYGDFSKLLATMSNVESADIPSAIQKLSQYIAKDIKSDDFKSMSVEDAQKWLETSTGLAGFYFRQFMKRHGHRCLKEFDVHAVPWGTDSKRLVKILQNTVGSTENIQEKKTKDFPSVLSQLTTPLTTKTKLLLRFLLPNCRRGVRERETCKSIVVKYMDSVRKGIQHLGKTMVSEGYLPDSDLLYFMLLDEIHDLLQTRNPRLIARANHRRKLFPTLDKLMFPEMWKGLPTPINESEEDDAEYVADLTMKGTPVSQGLVKGYARVALSLEEAAQLKSGEILITFGTDIGWSPYFPILAGVVTELGGLISHGAVVSREYGLPCVVGLHGATKKFATGDYVLLDGSKGFIQRLAPPEQ